MRLGDQIGQVTHYFDKIGVAVIKLTKGSLKNGDRLKFKTREGEFEQEVSSMQIEHRGVNEVSAGDEFGLKVDQKVKEGDKVLGA